MCEFTNKNDIKNPCLLLATLAAYVAILGILGPEVCEQFASVAYGQAVHQWENHICNGGTCCKRIQQPAELFQFVHSCTQCHLDAVKH